MLTLQSFNPYAATHRACDVTPDMMANRDWPEAPADGRLVPWALPRDFMFFQDEATEEAHRPTFEWLAAHGLGTTFDVNGHWHRAKVVNRAYAMQQFLDVLDGVGLTFEQACAPAFRLFGDGLVGRVNEWTGDHLSSAYMARTAQYVAEAYAFTNAAGHTSVDLDAGPVLLALSDDDLDIPADGIGFGARARRQLRRKSMTEDEWRSVADLLGPLRVAGWSGGMPSMRPRLSSEWGLQVGLRVAEAAALPAADVMAIDLAPDDMDGHVVFKLTQTKGKWVRDAVAPKRLVHASRHYWGTERRVAVEALRMRLGASFQEPRSLLVNGLGAMSGVGRAASPASLQSDLRAAVVAANLFDPVELRMPDGRVLVFRVPRFTFHSLRHTFAVWMYHARKFRMGDPEPWIYIRARLGHRHLSTTLDTYLDLGRMLEPQIGRMLRDTFMASVDWPARG